MTLNPLSKLVLLASLVFIALALPAVFGAAGILTLLAGALLGKVLKPFLKSWVALSAPFAIALLLIAAVGPHAGGEWWSAGPLRFGPEQAAWVGTVLLRVMLLLGAVQLFALTTAPEAIYISLVRLRLPKTAAYAATAAIELVPHLRDRIASVRDAQTSRGVRFRRGSLDALGLIGPLLLSALEDAADREIALLIRGFALPNRPTSLTEVGWSYADRVAVLLGSILVFGTIVWVALPA